MKVSELEGQELDYWVGRAQGWNTFVPAASSFTYWFESDGQYRWQLTAYTPSTNWAQAGELVEKYALTDIGFAYQDYDDTKVYVCAHGNRIRNRQYGPTPCIAICRAVVASVYGDEVISEEMDNE